MMDTQIVMQEDALNLLEDGLLLWLVALRHAPRSEPYLLALFPNLPAIMARSSGAVQLSSPQHPSTLNVMQAWLSAGVLA